MGRGTGVRATVDSTIQVDFRWQGKRYRERLALSPTPANLKYAARLKAVIDHEIATGTFDYAKHFPNSPRVPKPAGDALWPALKEFCESLSQSLEPETLKKYLYDAETVAAAFPGKSIQTLTGTDVEDWVKKQTLSKKRLDNLLTPLRGALRQAKTRGLIPSNPLSDYSIKRNRKVRVTEKVDPFTPGEIEQLGTTRLGALWTFWAWTGLRSGELIALRWGDVREDRLIVQRSVRVGRVKATKTVSGDRAVLLLPAAQAALARLTRGEPDTAVFIKPATGEPFWEDRSLARDFRIDCEAAGVRYRGPNQCRHTYATWALSSGENPSWIAKQMGHSDTLMLFKTYGRWMPQIDPLAGSKMVMAAGVAPGGTLKATEPEF